MTSGIFQDKVIISKKTDMNFIIAFVLLLGLGLVTLYSVSSGISLRPKGDELFFIKRQLKFAVVGLVFMIGLTMVDLDKLRQYLPVIVLVTIVACLLTNVPGIGIEKNGAHRWIGFGGFELQPSEPAKIVIVMFLANIFAKKHEKINDLMTSIIPALIMSAIFVMMIFMQNDFSTSIIVVCICIVMFFFAGISFWYFLGMIVLAVPVAFMLIFVEEYRVNRLIAFFKPASDTLGKNFQPTLARQAVANGGFWGSGIGAFTNNIPEVQSDYIFAGWASQMGFFGIILYFLVLIYFAISGYKIAFKCEDRYRSLLVFGSVSALLVQSLVNCAVVCGLLPPTGIPLPFFSLGGTSLIVSMLFCGLIINVSRWNSAGGKY
ncbi:MAG: putative lipid II flippase FtsW [Treponemataceae bacterium]|nr:putative lipid II flippase FtsW [Treponemataceae bacterium]